MTVIGCYNYFRLSIGTLHYCMRHSERVPLSYCPEPFIFITFAIIQAAGNSVSTDYQTFRKACPKLFT